MSISPGFTTEQIREFVHRYEIQPHGQKAFWLEEQEVSYDRLRRWRSAVFDGDLDRGLIPREGGVVTPPEKRTGIERQRARERDAQEAPGLGRRLRLESVRRGWKRRTASGLFVVACLSTKPDSTFV